jgi:hypothetical protein
MINNCGERKETATWNRLFRSYSYRIEIYALRNGPQKSGGFGFCLDEVVSFIAVTRSIAAYNQPTLVIPSGIFRAITAFVVSETAGSFERAQIDRYRFQYLIRISSRNVNVTLPNEQNPDAQKMLYFSRHRFPWSRGWFPKATCRACVRA